MRRGEEEVTAFYPEAGACAKAVWWQVALQGMAETRGRKEERSCVCVLPLRALGGCWRVSSGR